MKVGILSIQGLPARYGAFEQTIDQMVKYAGVANPDLHFFVGCNLGAADEAYEQSNVTRLFFKRSSGLGVIIYGLKAFFSMYRRGVRNYFIMGYGLAPFFWLFELLGCRLICNVDGFEWRRAKWGGAARKYFKLCERFSVLSGAKLIFDSIGVARYYAIHHRRQGSILFYGTEPVAPELQNDDVQTTDSDYLVVVMRMEPENHIREIVEGFLASKISKQLLLIGPATPFFNNQVKTLIDADETDRVKWLGPIYDRKKLQSIRAKALAYIHGHSVGGTNPTLVEACVLGRPVIAYGSIFNKEVLGERGTYFYDAASLKNILDTGTDWPASPVLDQRYTWEHVCHGYLKLLE